MTKIHAPHDEKFSAFEFGQVKRGPCNCKAAVAIFFLVLLTMLLIIYMYTCPMGTDVSKDTEISLKSISSYEHNQQCSLGWNMTLRRSGRLRSHAMESSHLPVFPASFWFVKVIKIGGSTLAGIFRAIAAHHGIQIVNPTQGFTRLTDERVTESIHMLSELGSEYIGIANHMPYRNISLPGPVLRFTAVRDPIDRSISHFYFRCSLKRLLDECQKDEAGLMKFLRSVENNYQTQYAFAGHFDGDLYDFIFVTERMDESLVAFKVAFGLSWRDIAYLPSKILNDKYETFSEMPLQKQRQVSQILSPKIESDLAFHSYASRRLNETIAQIDSFYGQGTYQRQLECFKHVIEEVGRTCGDGHFENRWKDNGKNFRCIDSILMNV
jgi:hypothetical protein